MQEFQKKISMFQKMYLTEKFYLLRVRGNILDLIDYFPLSSFEVAKITLFHSV